MADSGGAGLPGRGPADDGDCPDGPRECGTCDSPSGHGHHAHGTRAEASPVVVSGAYTAAPRPGVPNLAVYIDRVQNRGQQDDQLLSASTGIARATEMHEMKVENDMMRMRQVSAIDIPAGASVDMNKGASSGYHLMVLGVSRPLKAGEHFTLTLNFRHAGSQDVQVLVQDVAGHTGGGMNITTIMTSMPDMPTPLKILRHA